MYKTDRKKEKRRGKENHITCSWLIAEQQQLKEQSVRGDGEKNISLPLSL
jgi:hypothetical protein